MTFDEILMQVLGLLQRKGRVSYRALKRRFDLDEDYLEDLKAEIIQAKRLAIDEQNTVLVWIGRSSPALTSVHQAGRTPASYTPSYLAERILGEGELSQLRGELLLRQADGTGFKLPPAGISIIATDDGEASSRSPLLNDAEACFCQALDLARHRCGNLLALRAALSLGRLWQQQGKGDDARRLLAEIYGWFTEGFDTADLQQAKALIDQWS